MDHISVLKDLSAFTGVSGREEGISKYIAELFKNYCDSVEIDKFYNVSGYKKGSAEAGKKIMIMAHHDEIGLMVKSIDENGFIKFTSIGGVDSKILLAQEVVVHGSEDIYGVIGAKPPHLLKPEETKRQQKWTICILTQALTRRVFQNWFQSEIL